MASIRQVVSRRSTIVISVVLVTGIAFYAVVGLALQLTGVWLKVAGLPMCALVFWAGYVCVNRIKCPRCGKMLGDAAARTIDKKKRGEQACPHCRVGFDESEHAQGNPFQD